MKIIILVTVCVWMGMVTLALLFLTNAYISQESDMADVECMALYSFAETLQRIEGEPVPEEWDEVFLDHCGFSLPNSYADGRDF